MPGPDGKLTPKDRWDAAQWILKHWKEPRPCPVCKEIGSWGVDDYLSQMDTAAIDVMFGGAKHVFRSVVLICTGCGYTMLFNAQIMGLLPPSPPDSEGAPAPTEEPKGEGAANG